LKNQLVRAPFVLALALLGCGGGSTTTDSGAQSDAGGEVPVLVGHWASNCFATETGSARLDFDIATATWAVDYDTFGDATCGTPFVTVHIAGPYEVMGASAVVPGAHEARFGFTEKTVTPHGAGAVGFLSSLGDACGGAGVWADGTARDVLASGCPMLGQYPGTACAADYDLVSLDADTLRFGQRPADNDLCVPEHRPSALGLSVTRE
jgi:hypothetical protein